MPLQPLEQLQVLDLEANNVTSMDEVASSSSSLQELTLRAFVADDATAAGGTFLAAVFALLARHPRRRDPRRGRRLRRRARRR